MCILSRNLSGEGRGGVGVVLTPSATMNYEAFVLWEWLALLLSVDSPSAYKGCAERHRLENSQIGNPEPLIESTRV